MRPFRVLVFGALLAFAASLSCGGCDETAKGGAVDGAACESDRDCRGDCVDGECANDPDPNGAPNNGATNGTPNNGATNAAPNNGATNGGVDNNTTNNPFTSTGTMCGDRLCECDDGIDNDGDGLIDGQDPECTGPYDDDEGSFATGIPGDNIDFCQDCFFDGNSGGGDDGCQYHTECLYGRTPPGPSTAACFSCEVSDRCIASCRPLTPNGCDCFGCCGVQHPDTGETINIVLVDGCSLDNIDDEDACPRCVQSTQCVNECGRCELCPGRTLADLPDDCSDDGGGGGGNTCDDGEQVCVGSGDCPNNFYCQLGCCLPIIN